MPTESAKPKTRNGAAKLEAQREGAADEPDHELRHVAGRERSTRADQVIGPGDRGDRQVMKVGREDHHHAEQREEVADHRALLALARGIDGLGVGEAGLRRDQRACDLKRAHDDARHRADQDAGRDLLGDEKPQRHDAGGLSLRIGGGDRGRKAERDRERQDQAHHRRHARLADRGQHHHHRTGARGRRENRTRTSPDSAGRWMCIMPLSQPLLSSRRALRAKRVRRGKGTQVDRPFPVFPPGFPSPHDAFGVARPGMTTVFHR